MRKILILAAFLPLASHGADWRHAASSTDTMYFVEASRISGPATAKTVWLFAVDRDQRSSGVKSFKSEHKVNCKNFSLADVQWVAFAEDRSIVTSKVYDSLVWTSPSPDSVSEAWMRFVCAKSGARLPKLSIPNPQEYADTVWSQE